MSLNSLETLFREKLLGVSNQAKRAVHVRPA